MENKFVEYFSKISNLSDDEALAIAGSMCTETHKKGDLLLKEGQRSQFTYFILEGSVREFVCNDGEEMTTNFFSELQWLISYGSSDQSNMLNKNWICIEETTVVVGDEQRAQELFSKFPRLESVSLTIMETAFCEQRNALTSYLTDSPEERYLKLLKARPELVQKVPQYQIASYIGVKPESLSRIRKRINSKD